MIYRAIVDNIGENAVASRLSRLRNRKWIKLKFKITLWRV
jgi:hypothetical protein